MNHAVPAFCCVFPTTAIYYNPLVTPFSITKLLQLAFAYENFMTPSLVVDDNVTIYVNSETSIYSVCLVVVRDDEKI